MIELLFFLKRLLIFILNLSRKTIYRFLMNVLFWRCKLFFIFMILILYLLSFLDQHFELTWILFINFLEQFMSLISINIRKSIQTQRIFPKIMVAFFMITDRTYARWIYRVESIFELVKYVALCHY